MPDCRAAPSGVSSVFIAAAMHAKRTSKPSINIHHAARPNGSDARRVDAALAQGLG